MKEFKELFIIGGQRSGSTFLTNVMDQHPNVRFIKPIFPEKMVFIKNINSTKADFYKEFGNFSIENKIVFAEKCTSYFEHSESLLRIKTTFENPLIVFIIRDPVERALSNYFFTKKNNLETRSLEQTFLEGIPAPNLKKYISVDPFDYIGRSDYIKHISNLEKVFENYQLHYIKFDDLVNNTSNTVSCLINKLLLPEFNFKYSVSKNEEFRDALLDVNLKDVLRSKLENQYVYLQKRNLI